MNFHYVARRLLFRATCTKGPGTRIGTKARIINIRGNDEAIAIGRRCVIDGELLVFAHGGTITIGDWCFVGEGTRIWAARSIVIGSRVMISHGVNVFDSLTHPLLPRERHAHFRDIATIGHPKKLDLSERPVVIEDDAWIGAGVTVLRGVTIGKAAVVGAGSVVTKSVAPYTIVAGNPSKFVREINSSESGDSGKCDE